MKIALIRGPSLNEWEVQNWLPLARKHDLLLVGSSTTIKAFKDGHLARPICLGEVLGPIPFGVRLLNFLIGDPRLIWGLEGIIKGADIVCAAETRSRYSLQAVRARQKGKVKKVAVTVWENIPFLGDNDFKVKQIKNEVKKGADIFLAVTGQAKDALMAEGVDARKIVVVPMGVDQNKFKISDFRQKSPHIKFPISNDSREIKILSVGRLVPEKGFDDVIRAMEILESGDYRGKFKLTIVGEGPEEEKLREMAGHGGLSGLVSFKKASYRQMPKIYNQADIFVLASKPTPMWQEQYGMVLAEAASCGLAVVAARTGAIEEVLDKNGSYFDPGDVWGLARAISDLLNPRIAQSNSEKMAALAKLKFDATKVSQNLEAVLGDLVT